MFLTRNWNLSSGVGKYSKDFKSRIFGRDCSWSLDTKRTAPSGTCAFSSLPLYPSGLCLLSLPFFYFYIFSTSTPLTCPWLPCEILFCWAVRGLCLYAAQSGLMRSILLSFPTPKHRPLPANKGCAALAWAGGGESAWLQGKRRLRSSLRYRLPGELPRRGSLEALDLVSMCSAPRGVCRRVRDEAVDWHWLKHGVCGHCCSV